MTAAREEHKDNTGGRHSDAHDQRKAVVRIDEQAKTAEQVEGAFAHAGLNEVEVSRNARHIEGRAKDNDAEHAVADYENAYLREEKVEADLADRDERAGN